MHTIALTRASQLIHITDMLERLGELPERILAQAKLPMWHYCDPEDLVPAQHIYALMDQAARSLGDPIFGFRVGAESSIESLGSFGRLVASSLTVHDAFRTGCRLIHLHSSAGRYRLVEVNGEVWCCRSKFRGWEVGRRENEHYILMLLTKYVRMGAGPSWLPAKVSLQTREVPEPELREKLGDAEIRVGQEFTGIAVPRALLALPLRQRATAPGVANGSLEGRLRETAPESSFAETLRQLAEALLKQDEPPRIETMAEITGLSVRTLQRRLAKNGWNHLQIVDQARYRAATRLLQESEIRITDIATDLGYANSSHFTRAFKRWAGVTPREYRHHQHLQ